MKKSNIILFLFVGALMGLVYLCSRGVKDYFLDSAERKNKTIEIGRQQIYIQTRHWGVAKNHNAILFSLDSVITDDMFGTLDPLLETYVYKNDERTLVYRCENLIFETKHDTLFIYSPVVGHGKLAQIESGITIQEAICSEQEWKELLVEKKKNVISAKD